MTGTPEPSQPVVRLASHEVDRAAAFAVRHKVFVDEQGVPVELERDERDADADHFVASVDGRAIGAVRLVVEPAGFEGVPAEHGQVGHLGRLAVLAEARGSGLGAGLLSAVEDRAAKRGLRLVYLGAQTHAVGFYERLGYHAYGAEFDDAGLPHRHMYRLLS